MMSCRAFHNYMNTIVNTIDTADNDHNEATKTTFNKQGRLALHRLEKLLTDRDHNIRRWMNGKPGVFVSDRTGRKIEIELGTDREALYYFLIFCKKINEHQEVSEDLRDYVSLLITRSCTDMAWEGC